MAFAWDATSGLHIIPNLYSETIVVDSSPAFWGSTQGSDKTTVLLMVWNQFHSFNVLFIFFPCSFDWKYKSLRYYLNVSYLRYRNMVHLQCNCSLSLRSDMMFLHDYWWLFMYHLFYFTRSWNSDFFTHLCRWIHIVLIKSVLRFLQLLLRADSCLCIVHRWYSELLDMDKSETFLCFELLFMNQKSSDSEICNLFQHGLEFMLCTYNPSVFRWCY